MKVKAAILARAKKLEAFRPFGISWRRANAETQTDRADRPGCRNKKTGADPGSGAGREVDHEGLVTFEQLRESSRGDSPSAAIYMGGNGGRGGRGAKSAV